MLSYTFMSYILYTDLMISTEKKLTFYRNIKYISTFIKFSFFICIFFKTTIWRNLEKNVSMRREDIPYWQCQPMHARMSFFIKPGNLVSCHVFLCQMMYYYINHDLLSRVIVIMANMIRMQFHPRLRHVTATLPSGWIKMKYSLQYRVDGLLWNNLLSLTSMNNSIDIAHMQYHQGNVMLQLFGKFGGFSHPEQIFQMIPMLSAIRAVCFRQCHLEVTAQQEVTSLPSWLPCQNTFTKWLPPWRRGRITCLWIKSVFGKCLHDIWL